MSERNKYDKLYKNTSLKDLQTMKVWTVARLTQFQETGPSEQVALYKQIVKAIERAIIKLAPPSVPRVGDTVYPFEDTGFSYTVEHDGNSMIFVPRELGSIYGAGDGTTMVSYKTARGATNFLRKQGAGKEA